MISFQTVLLQFQENGEKTGWTYILIPATLAAQMRPGQRTAFRVKDWLKNAWKTNPLPSGSSIRSLKDTSVISPTGSNLSKQILPAPNA